MISKLTRLLLAFVALGFGGCSGVGDNLAVEGADGPKLLLASAVGMTSVKLLWPTAGIGAQSYRIERRSNLDGPFRELTVVGASTAIHDTITYFDTSVEPDQIYGYRVSGIGNVGATTDFSVIAGVRTPPRPGIDVQVVTNASTSTTADPDGYIVRIDGPTPTSGAVGVGGPSSPFVRRFSPLTPGTYTVVLSGVAANCRVPNIDDPGMYGDTARQVTVTDVGIHTISQTQFTVDCRDPTRGTIEAKLTVTGSGTNGQPFEIIVSGVADDATLPDDQRAYALTRTAAGTDLLSFEGIRPGSYEVQLRNVTSACTLNGQAKRDVQVTALDIKRIEFAIECGGQGGGTVDDPTKPFKLRSEWSDPTPESGDRVALDVGVFLTDNPPFAVGTVDVVTNYSTSVLRPDSAVAASGFSVTANKSAPGAFAWSVFTTNRAIQNGPIPLVRLWFTVIGSAGATTRTATKVQEVADVDGNPDDGVATYASKTQPFPEATLTVAGTGGSGNQAPSAAVAGSNPVTGVAGSPVTFSAAGSSDADGTIVSYTWSFPGGNPTSGSGAQGSTTYATAGNYTATLTVTDDDGATAVATRTVTVTVGGGANQPPAAVIAGANPLSATAGAAVALNGGNSSDPEGGLLTYSWSLPGGSPGSATGASVTTTYATPGTYTATLTVTDPQSASATATRTINVGVASTPVTWRSSFGTAQNSKVAMTVTLDLRSDLPETPGPEQLQSFRADSIKWNSTVLDYESTQFAANINGTATFDATHPGRLKLQGSAIGDGPTGLVTLATVHFTVKSGGSSTATTVTALGKVLGTPATNNFDYLSRVTVAEGTYPSSGSNPNPAVGGKYLYASRWSAITGNQVDLIVSVDPSGFDSPEIPGPDGVGGLQVVTTLSGSAAARFTAVSALATSVFGPATVDASHLPAVSWLAATTQSERTSLADVATLRFTIGTGSAGSVTTSTQLIELDNANGDALPIDNDGNAANGLGNTTVTEATLNVP